MLNKIKSIIQDEYFIEDIISYAKILAFFGFMFFINYYVALVASENTVEAFTSRHTIMIVPQSDAEYLDEQ